MGLVGGAIKLIAIPIIIVVVIGFLVYVFYLKKLKQSDIESDPAPTHPLPPMIMPPMSPMGSDMPKQPGLVHQVSVVSNDPYGQYFHQVQ